MLFPVEILLGGKKVLPDEVFACLKSRRHLSLSDMLLSDKHYIFGVLYFSFDLRTSLSFAYWIDQDARFYRDLNSDRWIQSPEC